MYISTNSLTSALEGSELSVSPLGRFTSRERAPGTHRLDGPQIRSGRGEEKNYQPPPGIEPSSVTFTLNCTRV
jgi:hypothetical protein